MQIEETEITVFVIRDSIAAAERAALRIIGGHEPNIYDDKATVMKAWDLYPDPLANWHKPYEVTVVRNVHGDVRSVVATLLAKEPVSA